MYFKYDHEMVRYQRAGQSVGQADTVTYSVMLRKRQFRRMGDRFWENQVAKVAQPDSKN